MNDGRNGSGRGYSVETRLIYGKDHDLHWDYSHHLNSGRGTNWRMALTPAAFGLAIGLEKSEDILSKILNARLSLFWKE